MMFSTECWPLVKNYMLVQNQEVNKGLLLQPWFHKKGHDETYTQIVLSKWAFSFWSL